MIHQSCHCGPAMVNNVLHEVAAQNACQFKGKTMDAGDGEVLDVGSTKRG